MSIKTVRIKTCDRCGAQDDEPLSPWRHGGARLTIAEYGISYNGDCGGATITRDLCAACMQKVNELLIREAGVGS